MVTGKLRDFAQCLYNIKSFYFFYDMDGILSLNAIFSVKEGVWNYHYTYTSLTISV